MSWFHRKPKHRHEMRLIYANESSRFNKYTGQFDLYAGTDWVTKCACGLTKHGVEIRLSYDGFIAAYGPVVSQ